MRRGKEAELSEYVLEEIKRCRFHELEGDCHLPGKNFVNIWEVHFKAVLILVRLKRHGVKLSRGVEFSNGLPVEFQIPEGRLIGFAIRKSTAREVDMV
jgi:hypothetical protein